MFPQPGEFDQEELHDTTGRTRYTKLCEKFGIVPCSYFTRHIQDSELVMKFHGLGPQGTRAIAKILKVRNCASAGVSQLGKLVKEQNKDLQPAGA
jgi:hypothetical protein